MAVVVLPTPPFWLATATTLRPVVACVIFCHIGLICWLLTSLEDLNLLPSPDPPSSRMFHVEHDATGSTSWRRCSTWNSRCAVLLDHQESGLLEASTKADASPASWSGGVSELARSSPCAAEQEDLAAGPDERLEAHQHPRSRPEPPGPSAGRSASWQIGLRQQRLESAVTTSAPPISSARVASRRNTDFRVFDSTITKPQPGSASANGMRRRASAAADVDHARGARRRTAAATSGSISSRSSASGVGSSRFNPVRLIFWFQVESSR